MGQEKNAENIPFLRSTQPKSTERVPVVELSGSRMAIHSFASSGEMAPLAVQGRPSTLKTCFWVSGMKKKSPPALE